MRRFLALCVIASFWLSAGTVRTQAPDAPKKPDKIPAEAKAGTLEQLQAEALKNNPDLRVSEAKLRLAEAEFARDRANLLANIRGAFAEVEVARVAEAEGMNRFQTAQTLLPDKISRDEYGTIALTYYKLRKEVVVAEARLQFLLGRPTVQKSTPVQKK